MPAAEDGQRQIAVAVVIAVEEAALLVPVQRIIGGIEIQHDLGGCGGRPPGTADEEPLDRGPIMRDLVIARERRAAALQSVQRRLAG